MREIEATSRFYYEDGTRVMTTAALILPLMIMNSLGASGEKTARARG